VPLGTGIMEHVPAPTTVWAVDLGRGASLEEVKGSLSLSSDALIFTPRDEARPERRFPLAEITRIRRLRGSPVLLVIRPGDGGDPQRTAFYFVQPPPLERPQDETRMTPLGLGRNTKRKVRRQNVNYLGLWNKEKKTLLVEWERQLRGAITASR
jgi:hypothetical protein